MYTRRTFDNVPDDWNSFWIKCPNCGTRYHASDGGCQCEDYKEDEPEEEPEEEEDDEEVLPGPASDADKGDR